MSDETKEQLIKRIVDDYNWEDIRTDEIIARAYNDIAIHVIRGFSERLVAAFQSIIHPSSISRGAAISIIEAALLEFIAEKK
jgi:hypothetical protein